MRRGKPRSLGATGGQPQIGHADIADHLRERGFDPDSAVIRRVLRLTAELLNRPRHLSQHVGGFAIADAPLSELVPVENATMPERVEAPLGFERRLCLPIRDDPKGLQSSGWHGGHGCRSSLFSDCGGQEATGWCGCRFLRQADVWQMSGEGYVRKHALRFRHQRVPA